MRRFIEKDWKIYFDVNWDNQIDNKDIDVTYGGYEISIDLDWKVHYTKISWKELVVKYYKEIKNFKEEMKLPEGIVKLKSFFILSTSFGKVIISVFLSTL